MSYKSIKEIEEEYLKIKIIKKNIREKFNNLIKTSALINEIIKIKVKKEKSNKAKVLYQLQSDKYKLFIDRNQDIPLDYIYSYLNQYDNYNGDISLELIIIEQEEPIKSYSPLQQYLNIINLF